MKGFAVFACMAAVILAPASFAKKEAKASEAQSAQAVLLDHNEYPCENCLFGMSDYYFCFDVNSKIMIGHEKIRTQMRKHAPTDLMDRGKTVPIRFDDSYIWVPQAKGKDMRLVQDYTKKIFLQNDRCQAAVK